MSEKRQIDIDDCKKESRDRAKFYTYLLMSGLVIAWGFDYVVAKHVLTILQPLGLLFFKYTVGMVLIICIKLKTDRKSIVRKKDIPLFVLCSICGEILYGYLLAFGAVFSWNAYNFLTASLHDRYSSITLTCTQLICTSLLTLPYAIHTMPPLEAFTPDMIGGIIYLGLINAGLGFLITVRSLHVIGPTSTALFSNFLPITSTFFGWILLHESISGVQLAGGAVVVAAACVVIKEKGKMEELS